MRKTNWPTQIVSTVTNSAQYMVVKLECPVQLVTGDLATWNDSGGTAHPVSGQV